DHSLRSFVDGTLEEDEEPSEAHVLPDGVRSDRARTPHPDAAARKAADDIDALGVEFVLNGFADVVFELERVTQDFVRRRLEDTAFGVGARVHAQDVAS